MRVPLGWLAEWIDLPGVAWTRWSSGSPRRASRSRRSCAPAPTSRASRVGHVLERARASRRRPALGVPRGRRRRRAARDRVRRAERGGRARRWRWRSSGTELPGGLRIKKSKIRGVVSNGMICSARGARPRRGRRRASWCSTRAAPVGAPLAERARRPARRCSTSRSRRTAATGSRCSAWRARCARASAARCACPRPQPPEAGAPAASAVAIAIEDRAGCARYVGARACAACASARRPTGWRGASRPRASARSTTSWT